MTHCNPKTNLFEVGSVITQGSNRLFITWETGDNVSNEAIADLKIKRFYMRATKSSASNFPLVEVQWLYSDVMLYLKYFLH